MQSTRYTCQLGALLQELTGFRIGGLGCAQSIQASSWQHSMKQRCACLRVQGIGLIAKLPAEVN